MKKRDIRTILLEEARVRRTSKEEITSQPLNLVMIESLVTALCDEYSEQIESNEIKDSIKQYIIDKLSAEGKRTIGDFTFIDDDSYTPWIHSRKIDTQLFFWNRYADQLKKSYESKVIQNTDEATDFILDRLGDPKGENFNKRGLVMGSVQMGKTLNFVGLINKAVDMGYKLIIVLAGGTENLRKQTQERIDDGFITKRDSDSEEYAKVKPISNTNTLEDFNKLERLPASLDQSSNAIVFVCKKNKDVLENLLNKWVIETHELESEKFPNNSKQISGEHSLLLIDDEADYASVNTADTSTKDKASDRTRINELIRQILVRFEKRSYVAYTATPFANIFIDPESNNNDWEDDDLFPKHFIYKLSFPSNYKGPRNYFGSTNESSTNVKTLSYEEGKRMLDHIIINKDSEDKEEHVYEVTGMTDDLKEAIRYFFLVVAERFIRDQGIEHNSMMINFQYLTKLQDELFLHVDKYVKELQQSISSNSRLPLKHARNDPGISLLESTFNNVFSKTSESETDFQTILKNLNQALSIKVVQVHHKSGQQLDYDKHSQGLNVIAIGGFSLSRGLTLEGLSVSFLDRTTKASDTLLQMGRWFGYRDGYADLCRIYIDYQSRSFLTRINETLDELYEELETMNRAGLRPKDFGLQVRDHAGGLLITAGNKMRTAKITTVNMSFWGQKYQSVWLPHDKDLMLANSKVTEELIINLDPELRSIDHKASGLVWRNISSNHVLNFLDSFTESMRSDNENIFIREFVRELEEEFSSWTIQLSTNVKPSREAGNIRGKDFQGLNIGTDIKVYGGLRKFEQPDKILKTDRSQIGASDLDIKILTSEEHQDYERFKNDDESNVQAARTALKSPVLTIFPIIPFYEYKNEESEESKKSLIFTEMECIFMYSLTIPRLMKDGSHPVLSNKKYALNKTAINSLKERAINVEEDKKLAEILEVEPDE